MHPPIMPVTRSARRRLIALAVVLAVTAAGCGRIPDDDKSGSQSPGRSGSPTGAAGASGSPTQSPSAGGKSTEPSPSTSGKQDCKYSRTGKAARTVDLPPTRNVKMHGTATVVIKMTAGTIRVKLDRSRAPCTVNSFLSLAKQGFYDKTKCPRLTSNELYVLQCGDPTGTGNGGPGYTFPDELNGDESYTKGTVAMANSGPNTNGSQFFLVHRKSRIDPKYTVFGTMSKSGQHVLAKIAAKGDDGSNPNGGGKPKAEAKITSVSVG